MLLRAAAAVGSALAALALRGVGCHGSGGWCRKVHAHALAHTLQVLGGHFWQRVKIDLGDA